MSIVKFAVDDLVSVTVLARCVSHATAGLLCDRLTIRRVSSSAFQSYDEMRDAYDAPSVDDLQSFLDSLREISPRPEERLFGRPQTELDFQFESGYTGFYPEMRVELEFVDLRRLFLSTHSNLAHLLPWKIHREPEVVTYNPWVSIGLGRLLPENFLFRERLVDSSECFAADAKFREAIEHLAQTENDSTTSSRDQASATTDKAKPTYTARQLLRMPEDELRQLAESGYDLSTSDSTGQTALMHAASPPFHHEQFWKLVRVGADLNAARRDGLTGLMLACAGHMEKEVPEWLAAGADVHMKDSRRTTALMLGARNGNIVADLLRHGACPDDTDDDGDTALDYALEDISNFWAGRRLKAVKLLSERLAVSNPDSLHRSYQRAKTLARRIRIGIDIDRRFGGQPFSEKIREVRANPDPNALQQAYLNDADQFIDLDITELELIDQIVEILDQQCRRTSADRNEG